MAAFELILVLGAAVLVSAVLEPLIPRVSLPLIQIALGVVIAIVAARPISVNVNPDFFLLLFVAPILFTDAKEANKLGLWRNRSKIVSLAVGLVVGLMLAIGFAVNALIPSIPLAAAFALGAALGPTDAVAVGALSKVAKLRPKEQSLLSGEALINDASGVVGFQFAIAAAVTGAFSLVDASITFFIDFFGGILLGLLLGWLAHVIRKRVNALGLDSNVFHVLFEVMLPFLIYLMSEMVHVSGILAVVAAGLVFSGFSDRVIGPAASRLSIATSSVWSALTFALNGVVFVLLGVQLPRAMQDSWDDVFISNWALIGYVLLITAILFVVRFVWVLVTDAVLRDSVTAQRGGFNKETVRTALVSTIGGPKGMVTMSVILSTPFYINAGHAFPQRDLIIFLASGAILCTLLLANFLLPIVAPGTPKPAVDGVAEARSRVNILRNVIDRLNNSRTKANTVAVSTVINAYNDRIERIMDAADIETESTEKLRLDVLDRQQQLLLDAMDAGEIDEVEGYYFLRRISQSVNYILHRNDGDRSIFYVALRHRSSFVRVLRRMFLHWTDEFSTNDSMAERRRIQQMLDSEALRYLRSLGTSNDHAYPAEVIAKVARSYQRSLNAIEKARPSVTVYARAVDHQEEVERMAYNFELEEVENALEREELTREGAKRMRDNVYLMLVDLDSHVE